MNISFGGAFSTGLPSALWRWRPTKALDTTALLRPGTGAVRSAAVLGGSNVGSPSAVEFSVPII